MNMNRMKSSSALLSVALLASLLTGCGGSTQSSSLGKASFAITWPERTRLIPVAANSINLSIYVGTTLIASQTVARPTSSNQSLISITGLPAGSLVAKAQAFPTTNGSGIAQASATQDIAVSAGSVTPITLTMASTITSLTIGDLIPPLTVGGTTALGTLAKDANGSTVLTAASQFTFFSANTGVATVDASGVVTAVATGNTTITATETESGVTATVGITVN
jgi:hypothetical protein